MLNETNGKPGDALMNPTECFRVAAVRCFSLLQRYHDGERTAVTRECMVLEVELLIGWLMELGLPPGMTVAGLLAPVEAGLLDRYGHEAGRRLNLEFVEVFEGAGMPLIVAPEHYKKCEDYNI